MEGEKKKKMVKVEKVGWKRVQGKRRNLGSGTLMSILNLFTRLFLQLEITIYTYTLIKKEVN